MTHARRTGGRAHRSPTPTRSTVDTGRTATTTAGPDRTHGRAVGNREHTAAVRAWARRNGYGVSDRGRIPTAVQQAFDAAH